MQNDLIKNFDIAYDLDEVVAELEEASHWNKSKYDENGYCIEISEEVIDTTKAIDIVLGRKE